MVLRCYTGTVVCVCICNACVVCLVFDCGYCGFLPLT